MLWAVALLSSSVCCQQAEDNLRLLPHPECRAAADGNGRRQYPRAGYCDVPAERHHHLPGRCHTEVRGRATCRSESRWDAWR